MRFYLSVLLEYMPCIMPKIIFWYNYQSSSLQAHVHSLLCSRYTDSKYSVLRVIETLKYTEIL